MITRRALGGLALAATLPALSARADVPLAFAPGDTPLLSAENERGLIAAIDAYRRIQAAGGWPKITANSLQVGDNDQRVQVLRQRLAATGDMSAASTGGTLYDGDVRDAVGRFQFRHGLRVSGSVSGATLAHLNVSVEDRIAQLNANLQRLRAVLPKVPRSGRFIEMNAPAFELHAVLDGQIALVSRVIVGKRLAPTPVVSAAVQAVDLLPYWHVPSTIATRDLIPTVQKDPAYLQSKLIRVYSAFGGTEIDPSQVNWHSPEAQRYVFRQDPGPQNALGLIRLDMPNRDIVYMHDTPTKDLFPRDERAFSAGCIRVQQIFDLAAWVIRGQDGWSREQLTAATASGAAGSTIRLREPVPVHFVYLTAWVQANVVRFRNDLYNRDEAAAPIQVADQTARAPFQAIAP